MSLEVRPLAGALGAEILGVDLRQVSTAEEAALHQAFLEHHVLAVRDQILTREEQLVFARSFGEPEVHPIVEGTEAHPDVIRVHKPAGESASFGVGWHTDNSFFEAPSGTTVLYGETIPPHGGDTLFASMERAWETLSEPLRERIGGLRAVHSARSAYDPALVGAEKYEGKGPLVYRYSDAVTTEVTHPIARRHPETGRTSLYVNPMFTQRIEGMSGSESDALLAFLFSHGSEPDHGCRVRWQKGTVTLWDNRCVWHYALDDYRDHERLMYRVTLAGEVPLPA
jgi:taurine dioxygenase